jgi:hypothetical protein
MTHEQMQLMGDLLGWVELLLRSLGVWELLGTMILVILMFSTAAFVLRVFASK